MQVVPGRLPKQQAFTEEENYWVRQRGRHASRNEQEGVTEKCPPRRDTRLNAGNPRDSGTTKNEQRARNKVKRNDKGRYDPKD